MYQNINGRKGNRALAPANRNHFETYGAVYFMSHLYFMCEFFMSSNHLSCKFVYFMWTLDWEQIMCFHCTSHYYLRTLGLHVYVLFCEAQGREKRKTLGVIQLFGSAPYRESNLLYVNQYCLQIKSQLMNGFSKEIYSNINISASHNQQGIWLLR